MKACVSDRGTDPGNHPTQPEEAQEKRLLNGREHRTSRGARKDTQVLTLDKNDA